MAQKNTPNDDNINEEIRSSLERDNERTARELGGQLEGRNLTDQEASGLSDELGAGNNPSPLTMNDGAYDDYSHLVDMPEEEARFVHRASGDRSAQPRITRNPDGDDVQFNGINEKPRDGEPANSAGYSPNNQHDGAPGSSDLQDPFGLGDSRDTRPGADTNRDENNLFGAPGRDTNRNNPWDTATPRDESRPTDANAANLSGTDKDPSSPTDNATPRDNTGGEPRRAGQGEQPPGGAERTPDGATGGAVTPVNKPTGGSDGGNDEPILEELPTDPSDIDKLGGFGDGGLFSNGDAKPGGADNTHGKNNPFGVPLGKPNGKNPFGNPDKNTDPEALSTNAANKQGHLAGKKNTPDAEGVGGDAATPKDLFGVPRTNRGGPAGREVGAGPQSNLEDDVTGDQMRDKPKRNKDDDDKMGGSMPPRKPPQMGMSNIPGLGNVGGVGTALVAAGSILLIVILIAMAAGIGSISGTSIMKNDDPSDNDLCQRYDNEAGSDSYADSESGTTCGDAIGPPKEGKKYTVGELVAIARKAGFNDEDSIHAAAVALSISGGDPGWSSGKHKGLFGINKDTKYGGEADQWSEKLENAWNNVRVAKVAKDRDGWAGFKNYSSGKYQNYLEGARSAVADGLPNVDNDGSGCRAGAGGNFEGKLIYPMYNGAVVTSPYRGPGRENHYGMDIATAAGGSDEILAWADGTVKQAGAASGFGYWIVIESNINGQVIDHVYGHMHISTFRVKAGDKVKAGQVIAKQGSEGQSSGPHLHFEIHPGGWKGGAASSTNPQPYLDKSTKLNPGQAAAAAPAGGGNGLDKAFQPKPRNRPKIGTNESDPHYGEMATKPNKNSTSNNGGGGGNSVSDPHKVTEGDGMFTANQINNIRTIIAVGQKMGFDKRAVLSALKISFNETRFTNYGNYGGRPWRGKSPTNGVASPLGGSGSIIPGGSEYMAKSMDDPRREIDSDSDLNSVGIYQQQVQLNPDGSRAEQQTWAVWERAMDPGFAAQLFFDRLKGKSQGLTPASSQGEWNTAASRVQGSVLGEGQAGTSTGVEMGLVDKYWDAARQIEVRLSRDLKADALSTDTSPTIFAEVGAECDASSLSSKGEGGQMNVNENTLSGRVVKIATDYANETGQFQGLKTYYSLSSLRTTLTNPRPTYTDCSSFVSWAYWNGAGIWFGDANGYAFITSTLITNMQGKQNITLATPQTSSNIKMEDLKPGDLFVNDTTLGSYSGQHTWMYVGNGKIAESSTDDAPQPDQVSVNTSVLRPNVGPYLFRPLNAKHPQELGNPIPSGQRLDPTIEAMWKGNRKW